MKRLKWTASERGARRWILRRWRVVPSNGISTSDTDILRFICERTGWAMPTKREKRAFMLRFWNHENGLPIDQQLPKRCGHLDGKEVIAADEMAGKIAAASRRSRTGCPCSPAASRSWPSSSTTA